MIFLSDAEDRTIV